MADPQLVRRKLARLKTYLDELKQVRPADYETYLRDVAAKRAVERLLQLLVEVANDINVHAIVDAGLPPPDSYYEGFLRVAETGLIAEDLAVRLAPSAGERNVLVHEYEAIDDALIYASIDEALGLYHEYARALLDGIEP